MLNLALKPLFWQTLISSDGLALAHEFMNDFIINHWASATAHVVSRQFKDFLKILSISRAIAAPILTTA